MNPYYYRNFYLPPMRSNKNKIEVAGEGKVSAEPDKATIVIGILSESKNLKEAQNENSETSRAVIQALLNTGIEEKDIRTTDYRIDNMYDFVEGKQIFRGYEVRHLLEVNVEVISQIGQVVDIAIEAGANIIYNIRFDVSNRTRLYNQALTKAIHDAEQKAQTIAKSIGISSQLVPFSVVEAQTGVQPFPRQTFATEQVAGISTPIQTGMLDIEAQVIMKFTY